MQTTDQNLDDVANLIMGGMPDDEEPQTDTEETEGPEEADVEETEVEEAEADPEAEDPDDAEDDDEDDETEEDQTEPELYTVKVDGEEKQVTRDELLRGYAGQAYIQKGMEQAAKREREAEQIYSALREREQQLAQFHQQLQQGNYVPEPQMPEDDPSDPIGNSERWAKYHRDVAAYSRQQQQLQQVTESTRQAQEQAMRAHLAQEQEKIVKAIPELADPEKGKQVRKELRDVGKAYGYSDEDLGSINDARAVQVLYDAMKWRRLQSEGKATATEKASKARKVVKPGRKPSQKKSDLDKARQQMRKTGSVDDVANFFLKGKG